MNNPEIFFITYNKGLKNIVVDELKEWNSKIIQAKEEYALFNCSKQTAANITYNMQSINNLSQVILDQNFKTLKELEKIIKTKLSKTIMKEFENLKFRVSSLILKENLERNEVEKIIGSALSLFIKEKVDLDHYQINYNSIIDQNKIIIGIDYSGDLSHREYKIFSNKSSFKGPVAYASTKLVGFGKNKSLLVIQGGSGEIGIEAALKMTGKSHLFFKKEELPLNQFNLQPSENKPFKAKIFYIDSLLPDIKAFQKNTKIAGVHKNIESSKIDIDWLDVKFEKESFDCIIWPYRRSIKYEKEIKKNSDMFFYQANFILKKTGKVLIITLTKDLILETAKKHNFKLEAQHQIFSGSQQDNFLIFTKQ